jgi:hypothetical protein
VFLAVFLLLAVEILLFGRPRKQLAPFIATDIE